MDVRNMAEQQKTWSELIGKLMGIAEEIFAGIEGFESGVLTVEVKANLDLKFVITKDATGSMKAEFTVAPREEEKVEEEVEVKEEGEEKGTEALEIFEEEEKGETMF